MTIYGLKNDIRKKVLICISVVSLLVGNALFLLCNKVALCIYVNYPTIKEFLDKWEYLGVFPAQITVVTIFGIITWIFNNYIWKTKVFLKILGLPNLNGTWEGVLESSYQGEDRQRIKTGMALTIKQTFEKMSCTSIFQKSESFGDIICLDTESSEGIVLKFTYNNKSKDIGCHMPQYPGYNQLRLVDPNTLSGTYFTQRIPSTNGNIWLVRRDPSSDINEDIAEARTLNKEKVRTL